MFKSKRVKELEAGLEQLWRTHRVCEDGWHSCPKSGECIRDEPADYCNCGADIANEIISKLLHLEKSK